MARKSAGKSMKAAPGTGTAGNVKSTMQSTFGARVAKRAVKGRSGRGR